MKMYKKVLIPAAVLFSCITFTPLVMPYGIHTPSLLSLPYTLWTGLLLAICLVFLTFLSIRFHPGNEEDES